MGDGGVEDGVGEVEVEEDVEDGGGVVVFVTVVKGGTGGVGVEEDVLGGEGAEVLVTEVK